MTFYGICENPDCPFPGKRVEGGHTPAYPITGWEVGRSGGGANRIYARERIPNRVRHQTCLPQSGEAEEEQGALL